MSKVFTSWKEIACHLGKGVRTVQRWERSYGLPVRRPPGRAHGILLAFQDEIDTWLTQRRAGADPVLFMETTEVASAQPGEQPEGEECQAGHKRTLLLQIIADLEEIGPTVRAVQSSCPQKRRARLMHLVHLLSARAAAAKRHLRRGDFESVRETTRDMLSTCASLQAQLKPKVIARGRPNLPKDPAADSPPSRVA